METFNIEIYAYPIGSTDWKLRKAFYFKASNLEIWKRDKYFIAKVIAHELPLEHYKKDNGIYGCRKAETSISKYANIDEDVYIFPIVQSIDFKDVWE